jgi:signal transduction histidine kinase
VLELLLAARGGRVRRGTARKGVGRDGRPVHHRVKVTVSRLRRKLGDPPVIETRPLRMVTTAAQRISASNLHERLAMTGPDDEIKELSDTFDGLLGRLERAFDAQRQFVANASHELRTPLARQRAFIEVALDDAGRTVDSLERACARVLLASEQQERLIDALLTLAQSQRGLKLRGPIDLAAVVSDALQTRQPEAQGRGLRVSARLAAAPALGDARLAERLAVNLVANAIPAQHPRWLDRNRDRGVGRQCYIVGCK